MLLHGIGGDMEIRVGYVRKMARKLVTVKTTPGFVGGRIPA
jgi:hypothetical protein